MADGRHAHRECGGALLAPGDHVLAVARVRADPEPDLLRVVQMLLVHDLVEIDAGDTFVYDETAAIDKESRERAAADRSLGCCRPIRPRPCEVCGTSSRPARRPSPLCRRFGPTAARSAQLPHPGSSLARPRGHRDRVVSRNQHMAEGAPKLWDFARALIADARRKGLSGGLKARLGPSSKSHGLHLCRSSVVSPSGVDTAEEATAEASRHRVGIERPGRQTLYGFRTSTKTGGVAIASHADAVDL